MLNMIPAMAWSTSPDGQLEYCNQHYLDFFGRPFEELKGLGFWSQFHPDDMSSLWDPWQEMMADKRGGEVQGRIRRADGEYRWVMFRAQPLLDDDGEVVRWYGVNSDIEDRKRMEDALRETERKLLASERNLAILIDSLPVMAWSSDEAGNTDFFNKGFLDYVGLSAEEMHDFGYVDIFHPDEADRIMSNWRRDMLTSASAQKGRIRGADGTYRWFYLSGRKFADANGVKRWVGVNVDIDDLQQAEDALKRGDEALRQSETRLRQMISMIPGWAWSADVGGSATFISQHYLEYIGLGLDEALGLGWLKAVHPDDLEHVTATWRAMQEAAVPAEFEARLRHVDGHYRWFLFRGNPHYDETGKVSEWFGVNIDIDDRKRAEEELRQSQAELSHITRMTTIGELAVSIAHEVNQPLMAIVTNAGTCLRWLDESKLNLEQARLAAERIVRDGHRAGDIIACIRAMARKAPPRLEAVDLHEAINDVFDLAAGELRRKGFEPSADFVSARVQVQADRAQLQQVLLNLIMNAIEAMGASGSGGRLLSVATLLDAGGAAQVRVSDTGPGLGIGVADRMFDAFYSTKDDGIGMGLSICRSILDAHGGRIWAEANEPAGTTFCFTLPLSETRYDAKTV
jgi:PAS domain S-box-containing protein